MYLYGDNHYVLQASGKEIKCPMPDRNVKPKGKAKQYPITLKNLYSFNFIEGKLTVNYIREFKNCK